MWNKLTHFVKQRNAEVEGDNDEEKGRHNESDGLNVSVKANGSSVMSHVYEQHPNLSVFHSGSAISLGSATTSPPASPSKGSRRGIFRRSFKAKLTSTPAAQSKTVTQADMQSPGSSLWTSPSPVKLIPQKVRASLQIDTFAAQSSNTDSAPHSAPLLQQQPFAVPEPRPKGTPSTRSEVLPGGSGSIRSILRDHSTPGTGQNVRFFSRDAYRVISPDVSEEISQEAIQNMGSGTLLEKLRLVSPDSSTAQVDGPSARARQPQDDVVDLFSPARDESAAKPRKPLPFQPRHPPRTNNPSGGSSRSSQSHADPSSPTGLNPQLSLMSTPPAHASETIFFTPDASKAHTANGTAFFTPEAVSASSPIASHVAPIRSSVTSLEEKGIAASLHEQLALQRQLGSQFEIDLAARDELVSMLTTQLQNAEVSVEKYRKEVERRQTAMRALRRKVGELEKICRGLEEEVERSREESFERSVMDEASEGALVVLHGSIGQLKAELEKTKEDEAKVRQECEALRGNVETFGGERQMLEDKQRELTALLESKTEEIKKLEDKIHETSPADNMQATQTIDSLRTELDERQQVIDDERERHGLVESQWMEEKADLMARLEARVPNQDSNDHDLEDLRRKLDEKDEEVKVLKAEVEAQWGHAEKADEKIKSLEGEKEGLVKSVQAMHSKVEELGCQWKEGEDKRAELENELNEAWSMKQGMEQERDQLVEDVNFEREHAEQLTQMLQEQSSKLDELEQERGYALDNVSRLEELLRNRDAEIAEAHVRIVEREHEAEELRAQMGRMRREHARSADEQNRHLDEVAQQGRAARVEMEDSVRQKAEFEVALGSAKERLSTLTEEVERLRRQVHELQQESADREVKLLQLAKAREQDKEDKAGLNIALDSKQQELELLKRKLGVKGTGGSTPAPVRVVGVGVGVPEFGSRRQSAAFATPSALRPPRPGSATALGGGGGGETPLKKKGGAVGSGSSGLLLRTTPGVGNGKTARMGPPPVVSGGTPLSASTSSLARSTSGRPRSALPVTSHRRASSVMSNTSEKENAAPVKTAATVTRRTTMIPA